MRAVAAKLSGVTVVLAGCLLGGEGLAQTPDGLDDQHPRMTAPGTPPNKSMGERPAFLSLRQDEDWSSLSDPTLRTDPLDRFKYVPLRADGSVWLSLAVDSYVSVRGFDNAGLGSSPGFDNTFNTRLNTHVAIVFADRLRLYGALKHGDNYGKKGEVAPPDRDRLDLHQAFVEVAFGDALGAAPNDAVVRIGRQELHYGDGRLLSARVGPNVRSDFDGVLLRARIGATTTDAFAFRGVTDAPKVFDNARDRAEKIWGVYSSLAGKPANLDLFYFGQKRAFSPYAFAPDPFSETRHTVGARVWVPSLPSGLQLGLGAEYQFGHARRATGGRLDIDAWAVGGAATWSFKHVPLAPALGVEAGVTSGDDDPLDGRLGTFRALAPPGRYIGIADGLGPGNLTGVRLFLDLHPSERLRLRPKATAFWRTRENDGVYSLAPSVVGRPAAGDRFVGIEPALEVEYKLNPHWTLSGFLAHFIVGDGFGMTPFREDAGYIEATISFKL